MRLLASLSCLSLLSCLISVFSEEIDYDFDLDDIVTYDPGFSSQAALGIRPCPDYTHYALIQHQPLSNGTRKLPYQRPHRACRRFRSTAVEHVIADLYPVFKDRDLAQLFRNAFPNTIDTTIQWHVDGTATHAPVSRYISPHSRSVWTGPHTFIITGDINAEWLRDSTNQLSAYQKLAPLDPPLSNLIVGAIATQVEFVIESPYCNSFQPPLVSGLNPSGNGQRDTVHPIYDPNRVFECKYELDSLANFLSLANQYHASTGSTAFLTPRFFLALRNLVNLIDSQSRPTFDRDQHLHINEYTFQRVTNAGTETLPLGGIGNPLFNRTGLIRSAFRPSDDATILPFLIPANAMLSVELGRTASLLKTYTTTNTSLTDADVAVLSEYIEALQSYSTTIRTGIFTHGVVAHPKHGNVFAYEVDGYGSHILMDDANVPSLLALPLLGFITTDPHSKSYSATEAEIYTNTRSLLLSPSNPYYLSGPEFSGIGGPHIGLRNAWPMSVLVQAMTAPTGPEGDKEIMDCLQRVMDVSMFGLINESVDVEIGVDGKTGRGMTRAWFAWANAVFAELVLKLAEERPGLVFEEEIVNKKGKYVLGKGWANT